MADAAIAQTPTTQTTAPAVPPPPPPAATTDAKPKGEEKTERIRVRGYERAKTVKARLEDETDATTSEPAAEREPAATSRSSSAADSGGETAKPATEAAKSADDAARRRADRAERIRLAQERERLEDQERQDRARSRRSDSEVEKLRKRVAELEPHEAVFRDEESLLAAAEAKGMSAEKLVQWMRARLSDPAAVAQRHAKTEADKVREELAAMKRAADEQLEQARAERSRFEEQQALQRKTHSFVDRASSLKDSHPLTAKVLANRGPAGLINFANAVVAPHLPADYSVEQLHDQLEHLLDWIVSEEAQGGATRAPGAPATGQSHSPKTGAEQPTTTLSNAITSQRVSVTEETPSHLIPRKERVRLLKAKLGGE